VNVRFLGLDVEYREVRDAALARVQDVLDGQAFVLGEQTRELEKSIALAVGVPHALACSSGSDALALALMALGIGAGDAVIVPSFTFFATAGSVARLGARPAMADVDPTTHTMTAAQLAATVEREFDREARGRWVHRHSGAELRAAIVVHLYGRAAPMRELAASADELGIHLIEDAAQAIGARTDSGAAGSVGKAGCLSFYPTKNLGGAGDGGMVTTRDADVAKRLARLRVHGAAPGGYQHEEIGINGRMGELQAAYLNAKLPRLQAWTELRKTAADGYRRELKDLEAAGLCLPPAPAVDGSHVYHQFVVRIPRRRDSVAERLRADGIDCRVFYPLPLHLQPCFASLGYHRGSLPASERAAGEVLALPIGVHMGDSQIQAVCAALRRALAP